MAENNRAQCLETAKIADPRVEIDTSPPFESVKEAVDRFGGGGAPWIPIHLLRLAAAGHDCEPLGMAKMEEQAMALERDLIMKEQLTHNVLKELEAAKTLLETLKLDIMPEFSSFAPTPDNNSTEGSAFSSVLSPGPIFTELNQAKLNLNRTSTDLVTIQSSLESLNHKLREDKILLGRTKMQIQNFENRDPPEILGTLKNIFDTPTLPDDLKEVASFEAEQFKRMTEASRYEVTKAMAEIELTKNSIKMAEMRLHAAKKMDEAAMAVEAIALAEKKTFSEGKNAPDIFPPNHVSVVRERRAGDLCRAKFIEKRAAVAHEPESPALEKFEETTKSVVLERTENSTSFTKFKFRNSVGAHRNPPDAGLMGRRRGPQDDAMVGRRTEEYSGRGHVSLSQMLREQSRVILHQEEAKEDGNVEKRQYFFQLKKKFGFIQVPVYGKNNKKRR